MNSGRKNNPSHEEAKEREEKLLETTSNKPLTLEEAGKQLELFIAASNDAVKEKAQELISLLQEFERLYHSSDLSKDSDKETLEQKANEMTNNLVASFAKKDLSFSLHGRNFTDLLYDTSLAVAAIIPRNKNEDLLFESIPESDLIYTSDRFRFNINDLFNTVQNATGNRRGHYFNPFTGADFNDQDVARIKMFMAEKGLKISVEEHKGPVDASDLDQQAINQALHSHLASASSTSAAEQAFRQESPRAAVNLSTVQIHQNFDPFTSAAVRAFRQEVRLEEKKNESSSSSTNEGTTPSRERPTRQSRVNLARELLNRIDSMNDKLYHHRLAEAKSDFDHITSDSFYRRLAAQLMPETAKLVRNLQNNRATHWAGNIYERAGMIDVFAESGSPFRPNMSVDFSNAYQKLSRFLLSKYHELQHNSSDHEDSPGEESKEAKTTQHRPPRR